jgi:hypothetical protein
MGTTRLLTHHRMRPVPYLLNEQFPTARAAGTLGGQTIACEPGPGSLTYTDTEGKLSVSGGRLVCSGGKATPAWGDPGVWGPATTRAAGLAVITSITKKTTADNLMVGWDTNQAGYINAGHACTWNGGTDFSVFDNNTTIATVNGTNGQTYQMAIVLRSTGAYYLLKGSGFPEWTLIWVSNAVNTATLYPAVVGSNSVFDAANLRVLSLAALDSRFATDDGLATSALANPTAGATATMTSDAVVEWTFTFTGAGYCVVHWRRIDAHNRWQLNVGPDGSVALIQVVADGATQRATLAPGTVTNGAHRIVLVVSGNVHTVYIDNVQKAAYTDSSNFGIDATSLYVETVGGGVSRLAAYPRFVTLPGGL